MKKIFLLLVLCIGIFTSTHAQNTVQTEPYLQTIFNHSKIRTVLEFGLGPYTSYFLESANKVISIEFITNGYGPETIKQNIENYRNYSNWIPIAFFSGYHGDVNWAPYRYYGSESVYKATSYQAAKHQSFASIDDFYITELNAFTSNLKKCYKIDVACVGGSIIIRGDIVQSLFGKVPVIIAHGTNDSSKDFFGYSRISMPDDYEAFSLGDTTIWINKKEEYRELIAKLYQ